MLLQYKILTVTHRYTKLNRIGDFSLPTGNQELVDEQLEQLREEFQLKELFYLATCNRTLFLFTTEHSLDEAFVSRFYQMVNPELSLEDVKEFVQAMEGMPAVEHFLQVGGSIDSLVVGERQILGQLREAFAQARKRGHIGDKLRLLFQRMVAASKDIYSNTRIGEKPVSIASLAVRKLLEAKLSTKARILLIGAGQTNTLVGKFLLKYSYENVTVFNRSPERAEKLAAKFSGEGFALSELMNYHKGFDCLIVCTGAKEPILNNVVYTSLLNGEAAEGKVIVDLAIPHNTDTDVLETYPTTNYIEIGGLRQLAAENRSFREKELAEAEQRLHRHTEAFPVAFQQRQLEIAMREVPSAIKAVRAKAVNEIFRKDIEQMDDNARAVLDEVLSYMEKKCIGIPMRVARETLIAG
jgi:glutamyl-tRNA reductase